MSNPLKDTDAERHAGKYASEGGGKLITETPGGERTYNSGALGIVPHVEAIPFDRDSNNSVSTDYKTGNDTQLPDVPVQLDKFSDRSIETSCTNQCGQVADMRNKPIPFDRDSDYCVSTDYNGDSYPHNPKGGGY